MSLFWALILICLASVASTRRRVANEKKEANVPLNRNGDLFETNKPINVSLYKMFTEHSSLRMRDGWTARQLIFMYWIIVQIGSALQCGINSIGLVFLSFNPTTDELETIYSRWCHTSTFFLASFQSLSFFCHPIINELDHHTDGFLFFFFCSLMHQIILHFYLNVIVEIKKNQTETQMLLW